MSSRMKIGYDAKRLFHNNTGLGNYSRTVVQNHRARFSQDDLFLFSPKIHDSSFSNLFSTDDYCHVYGKNGFWRLAGIKKDIRKHKLNIYHGLSNELPFKIEEIKNLKKVVTIHDLIFLKFPQWYPFVDRMIYREKFHRACKVADKVIAISKATKKDIVDYFQIHPGKIEVIYQSCSPIFYDVSESVKNVNIKTEESRPYGLFVSSISERKNLHNVLKALKQISGDRPKLLVVGEGKKYKLRMQNEVEHLDLKNDVEFLGRVSDIELKELYTQANFSIYPSFYEGFGIPILESLFCGTPVITSDLSSMPEAANGIGVLIDPYSTLEIKNAMLKLADSKISIAEGKILQLKEQFNPNLQAQQIRNLYSDLLSV